MSESPSHTEFDEKHELLKELSQKRYLLFLPKNAKDLRIQYPELKDYSEFASARLKTHDMLFVWWFACVSSPYYDEPDEKKIDKCIDMAYPNPRQRDAKRDEFLSAPGAAPRFPENIKAAIRRMESFNLSARMETMEAARYIMENCKQTLKVDISMLSPDDREEWVKRAPALWKLMEETTKTIERGAYGVSEDTFSSEDEIMDDGAIRDYRNAKN